MIDTISIVGKHPQVRKRSILEILSRYTQQSTSCEASFTLLLRLPYIVMVIWTCYTTPLKSKLGSLLWCTGHWYHQVTLQHYISPKHQIILWHGSLPWSCWPWKISTEENVFSFDNCWVKLQMTNARRQWKRIFQSQLMWVRIYLMSDCLQDWFERWILATTSIFRKWDDIITALCQEPRVPTTLLTIETETSL